MIIWLASYPRSGNTFARIVLKNRFRLQTRTLYVTDGTQDVRDMRNLIGEPEEEIVLEDLAATNEPFFVKTHEMPSADTFPAIYLVRDGRDALVSYAHFILHTHRGIPVGSDRQAFLQVLRDLIVSDSNFGGWSANVLAWKRRTSPTAVIRYEDFAASSAAVLDKALADVGLRNLKTYDEPLPAFEGLHRAFPWFFRKGKIGAWRAEMPEFLHELFWKYHWEAMEAFDYRRQKPEGGIAPGNKLHFYSCNTEDMPLELPPWALEMAWVTSGDELLPSAIDGVNLVLNRTRLAAFLAQFAEDKDVRDLLALDVLGSAVGLPLSSTGLEEAHSTLTTRPFRLWEYAWLYKSLQLSAGGLNVLDLGGPASHLSILTALAGCKVTSIDINPTIVRAAQECASALDLTSLDPRIGDMRDLSAFADGHFDVVISCSVLEHLTADDQEVALKEMARVLKPGGLVGLTFDLGLGAPGANEHLPPPHDPPPNSAEALRRYMQGGLVPAGNPFSEDPIPGSLFRHESIVYTVASLFLGKPPLPVMRPPQPERNRSRLNRLFIRELPYRIHRHVSHLAVLAGNISDEKKEMSEAIVCLQAEAVELRNQRESAIAAAKEQHACAIDLEAAAAERLAALHEKDRAVVQLHAELAARDAALAEQHQRAITLEAAAAERLGALHEKDQAIVQLHAEVAARDAALAEKHQRAIALEEAATERLAAMHEKDRAIAQLHEQNVSLQQAAAEEGKRGESLESEIGGLRQRVREFEEESALNFLKRRFNR